jgi:ATP-grasp domain, R2K clade family 3
MNITTVVLEGGRDQPLDIEETMMFNETGRLGLKREIVSLKQMTRGRFEMTPDVMAVGSVAFVRQALRHLGKQLPEHAPYPDVLSHLLYREVRYLSSLLSAKQLVRKGNRIFVKPAAWKRFTGFVAEYDNDIRFNGASNWIPVWISDPVQFVSEWRVYVAADVILDIRFANHGGDKSIKPDTAVITDAIMRLTQNGAPQGYVIDFGVLDTGETALVEMNDGFSFGAYDGLPAETLWVVMLNRWVELTRKEDEQQDGSNRIPAGHEAVGATAGAESGVA